MSPEEFQRIKEAEKEHLRSLRKLKNAVRMLKQQQQVNQALGNMAGASQDALGTHQEMIDRLALDTAHQEARMEIALENTQQSADTPVPDAPNLEAMEEDLIAERARQLLAQMKLEMGVPLDAPASRKVPPEPADPAERKPVTKTASALQADPSTKPVLKPSVSPPPPDALPEKTMGRMK